jgi:hypothetical protein
MAPSTFAPAAGGRGVAFNKCPLLAEDVWKRVKDTVKAKFPDANRLTVLVRLHCR